MGSGFAAPGLVGSRGRRNHCFHHGPSAASHWSIQKIKHNLKVRHLRRFKMTSNVTGMASHLSHFQGTIFRFIIVGVTEGLIMAARERLVISLNRGPEGDKYAKLEFCRFTLKRHSF